MYERRSRGADRDDGIGDRTVATVEVESDEVLARVVADSTAEVARCLRRARDLLAHAPSRTDVADRDLPNHVNAFRARHRPASVLGPVPGRLSRDPRRAGRTGRRPHPPGARRRGRARERRLCGGRGICRMRRSAGRACGRQGGSGAPSATGTCEGGAVAPASRDREAHRRIRSRAAPRASRRAERALRDHLPARAFG
jgi:hypothetical protein